MPNPIGISRKTAERIASVWNEASSLSDAMRRAGIKTNDIRTHHRHRRATEQLLHITLDPHNPKHKKDDEVDCPSFLDPREAKKHKAFVITSATNNSALNERFFCALEAFSSHHAAQLLVIPLKYRHNTLIRRDDYQWPERIYPYALLDDMILSKSIMVSSLRINATAAVPLSGMADHAGPRSVIYGATSIQLEPVATPGDETPKIMQTTGSCTSRTYTKTKAGGKAKFNHSFAATFVRLVGSKFYHTQLMWDGKGFYFLDEYWTPDGHSTGHSAAAIVRGDDHALLRDPKILKARKKLCERVSPAIHVFHDVFDGTSVSHHATLTDKVFAYEEGMHCLENELKVTAAHIVETGGPENWIVDSNHDRHLDRYLNEGRHLKDPHNTRIGSDLLAEKLRTRKHALHVALDRFIPDQFVMLNPNKRAMIKGIDVSQHGDRGANGARGSARGFAKSMHKSIIGHSHTARIFKGCWQCGVSTQNMSYKSGLSTWTCTDVLIHENGKRSMIYYIDGKSLADVIK